MSKELEAFEYIGNFNNKRFFNVTYGNGDQEHYEYQTIKDLFPKEFETIEIALKDYELLKERTKLDSFECLLRLEEILPRGKELLIPVAKELKRKQDLEQMLHKMNVKNGYGEYLKITKALEIIKKEPFISANWYLEGTYEEYINSIEVVRITEDEWNIVKEVLS